MVCRWVPFDKETGDPGPPVIMLTSDIAFINDDEYLKLVKEYAEDIESLERDFAAAWYRLTSQDMGPASRCTGPDVPPPQPFQDPLPKIERSMKQGDIEKLSEAVKKAVEDDDARGLVANLAFNCARTFRATSWVGGCNGGRIRFPPLVRFSAPPCTHISFIPGLLLMSCTLLHAIRMVFLRGRERQFMHAFSDQDCDMNGIQCLACKFWCFVSDSANRMHIGDAFGLVVCDHLNMVQIDDPSNEGASEALEILAPIQDKYSEYVSWADLIVYAGGVAAEVSGAPDIPFCPGRVDAEGDARANTADLSPRDYYLDPLVAARDNIKVLSYRLSLFAAFSSTASQRFEHDHV